MNEDRQKKYEQNIKNAKKILQKNRKKLYRIPTTQKYKSLAAALKPVIQDDLLNIIAYWLKHNCISYGSNDIVYFLSTVKGTYEVRKKTTKGVTNKRINYLCAIGLLKKLEQVIAYSEVLERRFMRKNSISKVNRNLLRYDNPKKQPMNTFEVFEYTTDILAKCNERAERLLAANITPGNISYNQLAANGLEDIAKEIYLKDKAFSVKKKRDEYIILIECIEFLIEEKGYTTKEEIFNNCLLLDKEIEKLFRIFKQQFSEKFNYKAPTKKEKEKFNINTNEWIITSKEYFIE